MPQEVIVNEKPAGKKGLERIWAAFFYSLSGLRSAIATEPAFRQEMGIYAALLIVLCFLPLSVLFKSVLFFANTVVLIVEMLNSAIEAIVDMTSPDYHPLAKRAKDMGSAAVFVSIALAIVLWLCALYQTLWVF